MREIDAGLLPGDLETDLAVASATPLGTQLKRHVREHRNSG
jgi:hypothetical protein